MNTFLSDGYTPITLSELNRHKDRFIMNEVILIQKGDWFPTDLIRTSKKIMIANTEQLCHQPVIRRVLSEIQGISSRAGYEVQVIDYSETNQSILQAHKIQCTVHRVIPHEHDVINLKELLKSTKKYDIGFVGYLNPRRRLVLEKLKERGYSVLITETFGGERDSLIAQCKSLVNIHCEEYFTIFESIRCNRWLEAGMRVITETSVDFPNNENLEQLTYEQLCSFDLCF